MKRIADHVSYAVEFAVAISTFIFIGELSYRITGWLVRMFSQNPRLQMVPHVFVGFLAGALVLGMFKEIGEKR